MGVRAIEIEGLHDAAGQTWSIARSIAAKCTVSAKEARSNSSGPLLRQAVIIELTDAFHYDQVVEVAGNQATVQLLDESIVIPTVEITPVAPVVALILIAVSFETSEWTIDELVKMQHAILNRVSGTSSLNDSNDISVILDDLIYGAYYPNAEGLISWVDLKTGVPTSFPLQHAIDYIYYRDSHVDPVPESMGTSFYQPPTRDESQMGSRTNNRQSTESRNRIALFDPEVDDDENGFSEQPSAVQTGFTHPSRKRGASDSGDVPPAATPRADFQPSEEADQDVEIAQLLLNRPNLTQRFLQLRSDAALQTSTGSDWPTHAENGNTSSTEAHPRCLGTLHESQISRTRNRARNTRLCRPQLNVGFTIWLQPFDTKPYPSVPIRAFALEFGIRGLSFMHFVPFTSLNDKAVWIRTSGVNMQNFSETVSLPAAPPAKTIDDILGALQSLAFFGAEYYSPVLSELIDTLVTFTKQRVQTDLVLVVYWINSVLECFRVELERSTTDGSHIKLRCSEDDADFRQILTQIQQRQLAELRAAPSVSTSKRTTTIVKNSSSSQPASTSLWREIKAEQAIPADVYAQIPVQEGKRLCLHFLLNAGCRANNGSPEVRWSKVGTRFSPTPVKSESMVSSPEGTVDRAIRAIPRPVASARPPLETCQLNPTSKAQPDQSSFLYSMSVARDSCASSMSSPSDFGSSHPMDNSAVSSHGDSRGINRVSLSRQSAKTVAAHLEEELIREEARQSVALAKIGLRSAPRTWTATGILDVSAKTRLSSFIRGRQLSIADTVRLIRNEALSRHSTKQST